MALIRTKDKLKEYLAISQETELETITPYLNRADREFIIPEIGEVMFNDVVAFIETTGTPTTDAALLARLEEVEDNFAFYLGLDLITVHVSESGIQRIESTDRKTAYQYQEQNLKQNLLESGYELLGNTLEYLEKYKTTYTVWASDTSAYKRFKNHIIHTPSIFQDYYDIQNSWAIFFRLRSILTRVEDLYLEPIMGADFLAEIKAEIINNTNTNAVLIKLIRKATVYLTVSNALHTKIVQLGKDGFLEMRKNSTKNQSDENDRLSSAIAENRNIGETYLKKLTEHLNKEASAIKYATYFNGDIYQDPTATDYNTQTWTNKSDGKSVIV